LQGGRGIKDKDLKSKMPNPDYSNLLSLRVRQSATQLGGFLANGRLVDVAISTTCSLRGAKRRSNL